eukprot:319770-Rhodomonas_salina.1
MCIRDSRELLRRLPHVVARRRVRAELQQRAHRRVVPALRRVVQRRPPQRHRRHVERRPELHQRFHRLGLAVVGCEMQRGAPEQVRVSGAHFGPERDELADFVDVTRPGTTSSMRMTVSEPRTPRKESTAVLCGGGRRWGLSAGFGEGECQEDSVGCWIGRRLLTVGLEGVLSVDVRGACSLLLSHAGQRLLEGKGVRWYGRRAVCVVGGEDLADGSVCWRGPKTVGGECLLMWEERIVSVGVWGARREARTQPQSRGARCCAAAGPPPASHLHS